MATGWELPPHIKLPPVAPDLVLLYSSWRSSCSWRVRAALTYKNITYETKPIDFGKMNDIWEMNAVRLVNPMMQVPSLIIDGHVISESMAILHYLEETRPDNPLLPKDPYERSKVRQICEIINSGIQPLHNAIVLNELIREGPNDWAYRWIKRGMDVIEKHLSEMSGTYTVGNHISFADCCLIPAVFNARSFDFNFDDCPNILRIEDELDYHPAFRESHPDNQPDCPRFAIVVREDNLDGDDNDDNEYD